MTIDTSKLKRYKPGYVHSNDGPGYLSMIARDDGEYVRLEDVKAITSALEQALTQQRGEPFAWAMTDHQADGPMTILTTNREDAKFWGGQGIDVEPLYKAPQPSADAVREDSARLDWIESQIREYGDGYTEPREAGWGIQWQQERPDHYWPGLRAWIDEERRRASGDELESLLSAASDHQQNAAQGGGE